MADQNASEIRMLYPEWQVEYTKALRILHKPTAIGRPSQRESQNNPLQNSARQLPSAAQSQIELDQSDQFVALRSREP